MYDATRPKCETLRPRITGSHNELPCTWSGNRDDIAKHVMDLLPDDPLRALLLEMLAQRVAA